MKVVLVDCLIYRGFFDISGAAPQPHQTVTNPPQPG